jgi:hypothetical protein
MKTGKIHVFIFLVCLCNCIKAKAQNHTMPLHVFYKDTYYEYVDSNHINGSFFPLNTIDFNLEEKLEDRSNQYYELTNWLLKKNWIELKGEDYHIRINPTFNFSKGRDYIDSIPFNTFQNTRGYQIDGNLLNNFSFSTSFYENQAIFLPYQTSYYKLLGERYPTANDTIYYVDNAIIPNGGRTKPFKENGFDYAYAIGSIHYQIKPWTRISTGNNAHFIGAGYRSLLLSDNSNSAPYIQTDFKFLKHFSYTYLRSRLMNLYRRPAKSTAESFYQPKAFSVNYLTYSQNKISLSLFDGAIWSKGSSRTSTKVPFQFYNPIPGINAAFQNDSIIFNHLLGLNLEYLAHKNIRFYGQLAMNNKDIEHLGTQVGFRAFSIFGLIHSQLQMEYNYVPKELYHSSNALLNYTNTNLPLGHTKGSGFEEFTQRFTYEYKRFYIEEKFNYYRLMVFQADALLPYNTSNKTKGEINILNIELGYRVNKNINTTVFINCLLRNENIGMGDQQTKFIQVGLKSGLINHYNDF